MEKERNRSLSDIAEFLVWTELNKMREKAMQRYVGKEEYTVQEVSAQTYLEVFVKCPYCSHHQDIAQEDSVGETFSRSGELRAKDLEIEITCFECERDFIVNRIDF